MRSSRLPGTRSMPVHRQWTNRLLKDPGQLAGVLFTVKDIFCVEGTPSTAASSIPGEFYRPLYRHTGCPRESAGDHAGQGLTWTSSPMALPMNPRHFSQPRAIPGIPPVCGSVHQAVPLCQRGCREAPLSIGTDTAGSIRQPAAFCSGGDEADLWQVPPVMG